MGQSGPFSAAIMAYFFAATDTYTEGLLRTIKMLSKVTEIPAGIPYSRIGALRYYPLGLILYTVFICGVAANRGELLKRVLAIPLKHHRGHPDSHIGDTFFYWYEAKALFNDAFGQRWCEPMAQRIRQVITDHVAELLTELNEAEYFFRGEFILALTGIDVTMSSGRAAEDRMPLPGLYLYMHEANDAISELLLEHPDWLDKLYNHPLNEILDMFDRNAQKMAASGCIPIALQGLKTAEIYQESLKRKK
jgi:hypothetical protein